MASCLWFSWFRDPLSEAMEMLRLHGGKFSVVRFLGCVWTCLGHAFHGDLSEHSFGFNG